MKWSTVRKGSWILIGLAGLAWLVRKARRWGLLAYAGWKIGLWPGWVPILVAVLLASGVLTWIVFVSRKVRRAA